MKTDHLHQLTTVTTNQSLAENTNIIASKQQLNLYLQFKVLINSLHCFDAVGWATRKASGL